MKCLALGVESRWMWREESRDGSGLAQTGIVESHAVVSRSICGTRWLKLLTTGCHITIGT